MLAFCGDQNNPTLKFNVDKPFPGGSSMPVPQWYFLPVIDGSLIHGHFYNKFREVRSRALVSRG
jgi:hypothetical protein